MTHEMKQKKQAALLGSTSRMFVPQNKKKNARPTQCPMKPNRWISHSVLPNWSISMRTPNKMFHTCDSSAARVG